MNPHEITAIILLAVVAVAILAYVCLRKILPLLGILKNQFLVEEFEEPCPPGTEAQ
jgi:hypothetical protein